MSSTRTAIATALLANLLWLGACSLPAATPARAKYRRWRGQAVAPSRG